MFEQINDEAMTDSQIFLNNLFERRFFPRNRLILINDFLNESDMKLRKIDTIIYFLKKRYDLVVNRIMSTMSCYKKLNCIKDFT